MPGDRLGQFHAPNLVFAAVLLVLVAVAFSVGDASIEPLYAASMVVAVGFLLVTAYEPVRDHDYYHVGTGVVLTTLFGIWWVSAERPAVIPAALVVLSAAGALVELYNLRAGSSYLRFGD